MRQKKLNSMDAFDIVNVTLVILITLITLYPLYFCIIASFSDPTRVVTGDTLLWIKDFTVESYKAILKEKDLWIGYRNTIIYTVLGTIYNLVLTIPAAYVLTKKYLPFRGIISWYFFITMYFSGGMVPTYLLMKNLGLLNNPLVMIIGTGVSCYNLIVTRQYFANSIPEELFDAAKIDGCGEWSSFTKIALPLAKPIIAVMSLYYGVSHWNSYYTALLYIRDKKLWSLQLVLKDILINNQVVMFSDSMESSHMEYLQKQLEMVQGMKYAVILIACLPLLIIYPFIQKYFAKGIMIGSVKG